MSNSADLEREITIHLDNLSKRKLVLQREWADTLSKAEGSSNNSFNAFSENNGDPLQHLPLLRSLTRHQISYEALASGVDKMKHQVSDCGALASRVFSSVSELTMVQRRIESTLKLIDDALSLQDCRICRQLHLLSDVVSTWASNQS